MNIPPEARLTPQSAAEAAAPQPPVAPATEAPRTGGLGRWWKDKGGMRGIAKTARELVQSRPGVSTEPTPAAASAQADQESGTSAAQAGVYPAGQGIENLSPDNAPTVPLEPSGAAEDGSAESDAGPTDSQARPTLRETVTQGWQATRDAAAQLGSQVRTAAEQRYTGPGGVKNALLDTTAALAGLGAAAYGANEIRKATADEGSTEQSAEATPGAENAESAEGTPKAPTFEQIAVRQLAHMLNRMGARDVTVDDIDYHLGEARRILGDTGEQISEAASQLGQTVREGAQKAGEVVADQVIGPQHRNRNAAAAAAFFKYGIPAVRAGVRYVQARQANAAAREAARPGNARTFTDENDATAREPETAGEASRTGAHPDVTRVVEADTTFTPYTGPGTNHTVARIPIPQEDMVTDADANAGQTSLALPPANPAPQE